MGSFTSSMAESDSNNNNTMNVSTHIHEHEHILKPMFKSHQYHRSYEPKWLQMETCPKHDDRLIFQRDNLLEQGKWCKFCYRIAERICRQTDAAIGYGGSADLSKDELDLYLAADRYSDKHSRQKL